MILLPAMLCWAMLGFACSENNGGSKNKSADKRMVLSAGEYNKGYQDGKRDAAASLIDANGSWMWDWMKEAEYRQGYHQGWSDGRQIKSLQSRAETVKQEQKKQQETKQEPAPKEQKQSSRANVQPTRKTKRVVTVNTKSKGQQ